jgi:hypothetical protein
MVRGVTVSRLLIGQERPVGIFVELPDSRLSKLAPRYRAAALVVAQLTANHSFQRSR